MGGAKTGPQMYQQKRTWGLRQFFFKTWSSKDESLKNRPHIPRFSLHTSGSYPAIYCHRIHKPSNKLTDNDVEGDDSRRHVGRRAPVLAGILDGNAGQGQSGEKCVVAHPLQQRRPAFIVIVSGDDEGFGGVAVTAARRLMLLSTFGLLLLHVVSC